MEIVLVHKRIRRIIFGEKEYFVDSNVSNITSLEFTLTFEGQLRCEQCQRIWFASLWTLATPRWAYIFPGPCCNPGSSFLLSPRVLQNTKGGLTQIDKFLLECLPAEILIHEFNRIFPGVLDNGKRQQNLNFW